MDFPDEFLRGFPGREEIPDRIYGSGSDCLTEAGAGCHDSCGTDRHMRTADITSGKHQVFDIARIKAA